MPSYALTVQFHVSPSVVLAAVIVDKVVSELLLTPVLFPPTKNTELLYHQYSTLTVVFWASTTVTLHAKSTVVLATSGDITMDVITGSVFVHVKAEHLS